MGGLSENDIFKFLELYKRSECLWKSNHKYYGIIFKRHEAYLRIRDAMNLPTVLEVKQKIKSFRDTYASERTKVRRSAMVSRHSFEVYKPKLRWYNLADSFLNNPEGILNVNCSLTVGDSHAQNTFNTSIIPTQGSGAVYSNIQATPSYRMVSNNSIVNQHQMHQVHGPERQHHHNFNPPQQQRHLNLRKIPRNDVYNEERSEKRLPNQSSEFYHFGMNIAMQLSSLPLVKALNVQTKIQQLLCEERIAHEQSRYEIIYDTNHSHAQFAAEPTESNFVDNPQGEYQEESIALVSSPREEDDIKEEFLVEDMTENILSGGGADL